MLKCAVALSVVFICAGADGIPGASSARAELRQLRRMVRATGTVQPLEAVSIPVPRVSEAGNLILTSIIPNGSMVQPGDIVAEFDRVTLLDKRRDAQAKYEDLSHQVEQRKAQHRAEAEKRASELQSAEADLAKAKLELRRGRLLSDIDRLKADDQLATAEAHVASLLRSIRLREQAAAADLRILELQRDRQKIAMDRAASNAERLQLRAPLAGMVAQEIVWRSDGPGRPQEGDQLWPGQPMLRIFSSSRMKVDVSVAEPDGAALVPGSRAKVYLDAYPDLVFNAVFESASPVASSQFDSSVRTFPAQYLIEESDPKHLLPDLSAAVEIEIATRGAVVSVPRRAIRYKGGRTFVSVAGPKGFEQREVALGAFDEYFVEIASGIKAGDEVQVPAVLAGAGQREKP